MLRAMISKETFPMMTRTSPPRLLLALVAFATLLTACESLNSLATSPENSKTRRGAGIGAAGSMGGRAGPGWWR